MSYGIYDLNKVELTREEQNTIIHFLYQAAGCGYPSANEPFYPFISSIMRKYYDTEEKWNAETLEWE